MCAHREVHTELTCDESCTALVELEGSVEKPSTATIIVGAAATVRLAVVTASPSSSATDNNTDTPTVVPINGFAE